MFVYACLYFNVRIIWSTTCYAVQLLLVNCNSLWLKWYIKLMLMRQYNSRLELQRTYFVLGQ